MSNITAAYHEAGHVIALLVLGGKFADATTTSNIKNFEAQTSYINDGSLSDYALSVALMAGIAAEARVPVQGNDNVASAYDDFCKASEIYAGSDLSGYLRDVDTDAGDLIRMNWETVKEVADHLIAYGRITYDEAIAIGERLGLHR